VPVTPERSAVAHRCAADALIAAIRGDVTKAWQCLDEEPHAALREDAFLLGDA